ncbi:MAG: hypothetical protein MK116_10605 [Phycisphaerales bacterium]|nr:hypothetical protein [Phycisphaerales bacterium]
MLKHFITTSLLGAAILLTGCDDPDLVGYWRTDNQTTTQPTTAPQWTITQYSLGRDGRALRLSWTNQAKSPPLGDLEIYKSTKTTGTWSLDEDRLTIITGGRSSGLIERFQIVSRSPDRLMTLYSDQDGSVESTLVWKRQEHPGMLTSFDPPVGGEESRDPNWSKQAHDHRLQQEREKRLQGDK